LTCRVVHVDVLSDTGIFYDIDMLQYVWTHLSTYIIDASDWKMMWEQHAKRPFDADLLPVPDL